MRSSNPYIKFDRLQELPTTSDDLWGQLRNKPYNDTANTPDVLTYYRKNSAGVVEPSSLLGSEDAVATYSQDRQTGIFLPPGFLAANITDVTVPTSNQTIARYLGQAPRALTSITLRFNVTTALLTTTWAEIGIATSPSAALGAAAVLTLAGFTAVGATFDSTGLKDTVVAVTIAAGSHVWALWGSQASTPFVVRAGIADGITSGFVQFKVTTRPSTMAAPSTFAATASANANAWIGVNW